MPADESFRRRRVFSWAAVVFIVAAHGFEGVAPAAVIYVSQDRYVSATFNGDSKQQNASDFSDFSGQAVFTSGSDEVAGAVQSSSLAPTVLHMSGSLDAYVDPGSSDSAEARSQLIVTFLLTSPTPAALLGNITASLGETGEANVTLDGPSSEIFNQDGGNPTVLQINQPFDLLPGTYTLRETFDIANQPGIFAAYSSNLYLEFYAPEPSGALLAIAGGLIAVTRFLRLRRNR